MLVGPHVSVAKGYVAALEYAVSVGGECMQFFAKSPRQWVGPPIDADAAEHFAARRSEIGFGPVFTHTAYLLNLASLDHALLEKSVRALADELQRAAMLDADGVVTHLGNDPLGEPEAAARRISASIAAAFKLAGPPAHGVRLLLENTAGAGSSYGGSIEELARCVEMLSVPPERLGVCIDTCHAFAYGYEIQTAEGGWALIEALGTLIGFDRVGLFHANDCMFGCGGKRDRHAWIGDGNIGEAGFRTLVCDERLRGIPMVTEMPGEVPEKDRVNMDRLKALRDSCEY